MLNKPGSGYPCIFRGRGGRAFRLPEFCAALPASEGKALPFLCATVPVLDFAFKLITIHRSWDLANSILEPVLAIKKTNFTTH